MLKLHEKFYEFKLHISTKIFSKPLTHSTLKFHTEKHFSLFTLEDFCKYRNNALSKTKLDLISDSRQLFNLITYSCVKWTQLIYNI